MLASLILAAALAPVSSIEGTYQGACTTYYGNAQPGHCPVSLYVDWNGSVQLPADGACFSPTTFHGYAQGAYVELRSPGWRAQPQGQFLALSFRQDPYDYYNVIAEGSGYGISDRKYQYNCSFRKVW